MLTCRDVLCCAVRVAYVLQGNTSVVADLFGWGEDTDYPTLTGNDESVKTPGLFLLGSQVRHQAKKDLWIFCFIYKCETLPSSTCRRNRIPNCFFPHLCSTVTRLNVARPYYQQHYCTILHQRVC